jgi:NAD(P)-dependent dehydrogenase (short-subunit alcohol dehydrogenase family)
MAHWLITGVSSGFGLELARAAPAHGDSVVGTLRQPAQADRFGSRPGAPRAAARRHARERHRSSGAAGLKRAGPIDVLVNNAGYGCSVPSRNLRRQARQVMETNFFGALAVRAPCCRICASGAPGISSTSRR